MRPPLRRELADLVLLAAGAIPGALLRWQLDGLAAANTGPYAGLLQASLLANLAGCLLIGLLIVQPPQRARLYLLAGIGFCGSLTTFSSWMLALARRLSTGELLAAAGVLLVSLFGGLALVALGAWLGRQLWRQASP
ncbi:CrcB protein [Cyanobium sp. PCC 7001]|uniref:fluoride efflux transporter FluC n=1 Tax=Cyanobium sp. PCC 7001 TaxID=180281 RepID=UPI0001805969|nr:CrcB family protein [Cyanobium sp. PCC 7001]EDY37309.1 CrcB protein [Cyanobium sp. PCC 7001]